MNNIDWIATVRQVVVRTMTLAERVVRILRHRADVRDERPMLRVSFVFFFKKKLFLFCLFKKKKKVLLIEADELDDEDGILDSPLPPRMFPVGSGCCRWGGDARLLLVVVALFE